MAIISGTAVVDDVLQGTNTDDKISGLSGDDTIRAGAGDDTIIGGRGDDIVWGGVGADKFVFSAGHITDGGTDFLADFNLRQGDTVQFLDSGSGQIFEVLSVTKERLEITDINEYDLQNNALGHDVIFTVRNAATGATQDIVLLDSWSGELADDWDAYLADLGLSWGDGGSEPSLV